jgi:hypothetical protein
MRATARERRRSFFGGGVGRLERMPYPELNEYI